jgi:8-oxo-dGTP diphosphatase
MAVRNSPSRRAAFSVDLVVMTCRDRQLCVLTDVQGAGRQKSVTLPWDAPSAGERLDAAATRIVKRACGVKPAWIEQAGAYGDDAAHPGDVELSVCYVALIPSPGGDAMWLNTQPMPAFRDRQRTMVSGALAVVRSRLEQSPIAFSMLPREFTLSELQQTYETVLARRLHKASFRRSLQAAFLVEPTGEWRGEGRGRPAQLYRYSARRRKGTRRGVRLDLL